MKKSIVISFTVLLLALNAGFALSQTARLQIIHNSADPAAKSVDIYVNGDLLLDNFRFRKATPYVDVPANAELTIGVAPNTSTSADDIIAALPPITLEENGTYVAIANGVLDPAGFAPNPEGRDTAFQLYIKEMARETAGDGNVDLFIFHGSTDAPVVDIIERKLGKIVDDAGYGDMTGYLTVPADIYADIDISLGNDNTAVVGSYRGSLYKHSGDGAVVFASGFLTPAANQDGAAFDVLIAFPDGRVDRFKLWDMARLQVIHNAADPAAAEVDVYLNGDLLLDNFVFRAATPYIDAPANTPLTISVAPPNSASSAEAIAEFDVSLLGGKSYVVVANGVVGEGFSGNPDGMDIAFTLLVKEDTREKAIWQKWVEFVVLHGAGDAPAVDVLVSGAGLNLVDNLAYGEFTDYLRVKPMAYTLDITPAEDNNTVVASYLVDLSGLAGGSAVVFASGFLTPGDDNDGPAFGLFAALPDGQVVEFPAAVTAQNAAQGQSYGNDLAVARSFELQQNYPNPFNPATTISFSIPEASFVTLKVFDSLGRKVSTLMNERRSAGMHDVVFNAAGLASGKYFYRLSTANNTAVGQMILLK